MSPNNATNATKTIANVTNTISKGTPPTTSNSQSKTSHPLPPPPLPPPPLHHSTNSTSNSTNPHTSANTANHSSSSTSKTIRPSIPLKRPPDPSSTVSKALHNTPKPSSNAPRPVKRQRTTPPPTRSVPPPPPPPPPRPPPPPVRRTPTPTLPPLPALLSPTLPKSIEEALAAEDVQYSSLSKSQRPPATSNGAHPSKSSIGKKAPLSSSATPSGRPAADSPGKVLAKKSVHSSTSSKIVVKRSSSPNPTVSKLSKPMVHWTRYQLVTNPPRDSLCLSFKFRKRAKDYVTFSKLSAKDRQRPSPVENGSSTRYKTSHDNITKSSAVGSPEFKQPAAKLSKDKEAITPPPRKVNGAAALRKPEPDGGGGAATTPSSTRDDRNGIAKHTSASSAFNAEYEKLSALGKSIKHEADAVFRSGITDPKELRRALVLAVDSTLTFILAFALTDRSRQLENTHPQVEMWRSFLQFSLFVSEKAKSLRAMDLHGFCKQIEAIVRQHLFDMDVNAYGKVTFPENSSKAPTPDSTNSGSIDRMNYNKIKLRLTRDSRDLRDCWIEGLKHLTYDEIQANFPNTYKARSVKWVDPIHGVPKSVGDYKLPFQLPLHRNTTPLEGLNFGRLFLEEWAVENGIKYKSRLSKWMGS